MKKLILLFFCVSFTSLYAQRYNFKHYTRENGLAQSQINGIEQDDLGYLWIATESGLSRFDGIDFLNFSMDDGLPDNKIEKLCFDTKNTIWVGTPKGIAELVSGDKFRSYLFEETQHVNDIQMFKGQLYIATNMGLLRFKEGEFEEMLYPEGDLNIRSICNYQDSLLICGGRDGIYSWNSKFSPLQDTVLSSLNVSGIALQMGKLIISTYGSGLLKYDINNNHLSSFNTDLERIRSIYVDDEVILCSTLNGAIEIKEGRNVYINEYNGLIYQNLRCSFRDNENNYWFGSNGNGLFKFLGKSITSYSTSDGLSSNIVMSISQKKNGAYTYGTYDSGVTILHNDSSLNYVSKENGLPSNVIWDIYNYGADETWIATTNGIMCLANGSFIHEDITAQIDSKIRCIESVADGLMFAGADGLFYYKMGNLQKLEGSTSLNVNDLCFVDNILYVASREGLYKSLFDENFAHFERIELDEIAVNTVAHDNQSNLWIGTSNGLKLMLKNGPIVPIVLDREDFKSKSIFGLERSEAGNMWVSTMNGVYQISQSKPNTNGFTINHYGSSEGMIDLESNLNAIYEDDKGMIWVGTASGLALIDPSLNNDLFDFKSPMLHFTGMRLFMEEFDYNRFSVKYAGDLDLPSHISLPYDQNHLTFDFIGISLKNPESVLYEYRLLGSNENWSPPSPAKYATYSNVSPGDYIFEVRAINKGLNLSEVQGIHITIRSPFWQTWWFIITLFMLTFFLVVALFQMRISAIKQKQENEKLGFKNRLLFLEQQSLNASMNRHFIFNSLNSIQYFINSSDKLSANRYLSNFAKLIRKNLDSSTNNNFIVTLQEEIDRIKLYLTLEKMRFREKFDYKLTISSTLDADATEIPSMILQPFVENSIIHGVLPLENNGLIEIKIYEEFDEVVFEVIDNGIGIDNPLKNKRESISGDHESKGMEITNRRIELLRKLTGENLMIIGPFQLNSEDGKCLGTKVIIKMGQTAE